MQAACLVRVKAHLWTRCAVVLSFANSKAERRKIFADPLLFPSHASLPACFARARPRPLAKRKDLSHAHARTRACGGVATWPAGSLHDHDQSVPSCCCTGRLGAGGQLHCTRVVCAWPNCPPMTTTILSISVCGPAGRSPNI